MDPKERRLRERWHLYDAAIRAGRFAPTPNFKELAPLTIRERALVLKFIAMERRQGSCLETPREEEIRAKESCHCPERADGIHWNECRLPVLPEDEPAVMAEEKTDGEPTTN
jgi:hypothetical protein